MCRNGEVESEGLGGNGGRGIENTAPNAQPAALRVLLDALQNVDLIAAKLVLLYTKIKCTKWWFGSN